MPRSRQRAESSSSSSHSPINTFTPHQPPTSNYYPSAIDVAQVGQPAPSQSPPPSPGKKKHACLTCDKTFTTSGHLARHARIHTGERNHKCPFPGCETRCSRQDNLQQHYRIHLSPGSRRSSKKAARAKAAGSKLNPANTTSATAEVVSDSPPLSPPPLAPATHDPGPGPDDPPLSPPPLVQAYPPQQAVTSPYATSYAMTSPRHVSLSPIEPPPALASAYAQPHRTSLDSFGGVLMQTSQPSTSASTTDFHHYSPPQPVHHLSNTVHTHSQLGVDQNRWSNAHEEMIVASHGHGQQHVHDTGERTTTNFSFVDMSHASHPNPAAAPAQAVPYGHSTAYDASHALYRQQSHELARYRSETALTDRESYPHSPHTEQRQQQYNRPHFPGDYHHYQPPSSSHSQEHRSLFIASTNSSSFSSGHGSGSISPVSAHSQSLSESPHTSGPATPSPIYASYALPLTPTSVAAPIPLPAAPGARFVVSSTPNNVSGGISVSPPPTLPPLFAQDGRYYHHDKGSTNAAAPRYHIPQGYGSHHGVYAPGHRGHMLPTWKVDISRDQ